MVRIFYENTSGQKIRIWEYADDFKYELVYQNELLSDHYYNMIIEACDTDITRSSLEKMFTKREIDIDKTYLSGDRRFEIPSDLLDIWDNYSIYDHTDWDDFKDSDDYEYEESFSRSKKLRIKESSNKFVNEGFSSTGNFYHIAYDLYENGLTSWRDVFSRIQVMTRADKDFYADVIDKFGSISEYAKYVYDEVCTLSGCDSEFVESKRRSKKNKVNEARYSGRYYVADSDEIPLKAQPEEGYSALKAVERAQREAERDAKMFNTPISETRAWYCILDKDLNRCPELEKGI